MKTLIVSINLYLRIDENCCIGAAQLIVSEFNVPSTLTLEGDAGIGIKSRTRMGHRIERIVPSSLLLRTHVLQES